VSKFSPWLSGVVVVVLLSKTPPLPRDIGRGSALLCHHHIDKFGERAGRGGFAGEGKGREGKGREGKGRE